MLNNSFLLLLVGSMRGGYATNEEEGEDESSSAFSLGWHVGKIGDEQPLVARLWCTKEKDVLEGLLESVVSSGGMPYWLSVVQHPCFSHQPFCHQPTQYRNPPPEEPRSNKVLPQQPVGWLLERTTGALLVLVHRPAVTDRGKRW